MKADLDRLMAERELDALVIAGGDQYSDVRDYLSNGAQITGGYIVKKRGDAPLMVVGGMEIEEARKSGLDCITFNDLDYLKLRKEHDAAKTNVLFWGKLMQHVGVIEGTIGIYGVEDINKSTLMVDLLREEFPQYEIVGELGKTLFAEAYLTKDAQEIARLQSVAQRTNAVVQQVWDFLAAHHENAQGFVVADDDTVLTVGAVKRFARRALLDVELEDTHMIFAPGRDGAFPHSRGEASTPLRTGEAIVFDFFPREAGGGYYHDMTRTWCLGYAPTAVQQLYDTVMSAFDIAVETYALGKKTHLLQEAVLDYFESNGHPTTRTTDNPTEGYVHSLGHGIGLNIHEAPALTHLSQEDVFQIGNVLTIEPGLYYPERGIGVRIEDSFIVNSSGELVSLTPFPKALVLPLAVR